MSRERARRSLVAATLVTALAGASAAHAASPEDRAAARQHYNQAEQLKKKGQLAEACKHLEEVERLDPKLPTLLELAECTEQAGEVVEAQAWWALARDRAKHDEKPQSRARAESRLAAVQKRVAHLTLQLASTASGAQVLCDDAAIEPATLTSSLPMNPGDHVVVVKLAGHDDAKYPIKLADGDNQTLAIAPGPAGGHQAVAAPAPPPPPLPTPLPSAGPSSAPKVDTAASPQEAPAAKGWWTGERTTGVLLGAVGLVAIGGGTALCVVANNDSKGRGVAGDQRLAFGGISIAGGGVLFISGLLLLAGASSDAAAQHAQLRVAPTMLFARDATVLGAAGEF